MTEQLSYLYHKAFSSIAHNTQVEKEINRARSLNPTSINSNDFLREYAWTVFNSGIKMRIIRKKWDSLQKVFSYWDHQEISKHKEQVRANALLVFNNHEKIGAVLDSTDFIDKQGWEVIKSNILQGMIRTDNGNFLPSKRFFDYVSSNFSWLGLTNRRYLAKNLGFDIAKDDRHLRRLAEQYGYQKDADGVQTFVEKIARYAGERISVTETVLWNACEAGAI